MTKLCCNSNRADSTACSFSSALSRSSNSSIPLLRPFGCASDGEGGPAPVQAKRRAPGRALPSGWYILPAAVLGLIFWIDLGFFIWRAL